MFFKTFWWNPQKHVFAIEFFGWDKVLINNNLLGDLVSFEHNHGSLRCKNIENNTKKSKDFTKQPFWNDQ